MREVVTKVYQYGELSDKAKSKARDWMRQIEDEGFCDFGTDYVFEDFQTVADILGITLKTRDVTLISGKSRSQPCIWWRGFSSQGDGLCFEGSYSYAKQSCHKIREHAPVDAELHRIADELFEVQRQWQYALAATVTSSGREVYSSSTTIDVEDNVRGRDIGDAAEVVSQALRDLMDWLYKQLEAQYEYCLSDEVLAETIEGNAYEFHEDGTRA